MFELAILLGIYAYSIFFLGLFGVLYQNVVILLTACFIILAALRFTTRFFLLVKETRTSLMKNKVMLVFGGLLLLLFLVNLLGALSPELSFDALWYHLTLPKLYLLHHSIFYISGGLLHYSAMPQLGETLYIGALAFGNEITVKVLHLLFGLLTARALYMLAKKYFTSLMAMLTVVIFYSNIVVAWESTTAYVDLIRTFYEFMALWAFLLWFDLRKRKWLIISAIMVGFAICTKLLALGSVGIFVILILYTAYEKRKCNVSVIRDVSLFVITALVVALPWFLYAFMNTGNPVYPLFSNSIELSSEKRSVINFLPDVWKGFMQSSDPISPIYMIFLPLIIIFYPKFSKESKLVTLYSLLAIIIWYLTPRMGGGRFLLPYLPAFSILCAAVLFYISNKRNHMLYRFLLGIIIFVSVTTIGYRAAATYKYLPVLTGEQTKTEFLNNNLNFNFGDFYDTDNYFSQHINSTDRVLLYGFHNLYYVEFPYIHATWVAKGDTFNYIAVQGDGFPVKYRNWQLIYSNDKTTVKLYQPPTGFCKELCVY